VPSEVLLRDVSLLGGPRFHHREQRPEAPGPVPIFQSIRDWLQEESGVSLVVDGTSFRRRRIREASRPLKVALPIAGQVPRQLPKVKIDIKAMRSSSSPGSSGRWATNTGRTPRGQEPSATQPLRSSPRTSRARGRCRPATCMTWFQQSSPGLIGRAADFAEVLARSAAMLHRSPNARNIRSSPFVMR